MMGRLSPSVRLSLAVDRVPLSFFGWEIATVMLLKLPCPLRDFSYFSDSVTGDSIGVLSFPSWLVESRLGI